MEKQKTSFLKHTRPNHAGLVTIKGEGEGEGEGER
jgi:hypothetical protein